MSITPLPTPPEITDTPTEFNTKAFAWVEALDTFTTEANQLASDVSDDAAAVAAAALDAATVESIYAVMGPLYLGAKTTDPALDNDGNALVAGATYYNSDTDRMRVYSGSTWSDTGTAIPVTFVSDVFSGTGSETNFTLSEASYGVNAVQVYISGVRKVPTTDYTVSGTTLTFTTAPPVGTGNIYVLSVTPINTGVPDDNSVSSAKIQTGAVTEAKLGTGAVTSTKLGTGAVTSSKIDSGAVGSTALATSAVTEAKLGTGAVTSTKLGTGAVTSGKIDSGAVTEAKLGTGAVTYAKMQNVSAASRILGRKTAGAGVMEECTLSEILDFIGSAAQGDLLYRGESGWGLLAAGKQGVAKAWGHVTNSGGTHALTASHNITGISDGATGIYTVTIATDMANSTYAVAGVADSDNGANTRIFHAHNLAPGSFGVITRDAGGSAADSTKSFFVVHGDA